jgi:chemotaxis protein CheD
MKVYDGSESNGDADIGEQRKVGIAEYDVVTDGAELTTSGLGSCIGVALYDTGASVAGLVHVMLPAADEMEDGSPAKFADSGTELLIEEMEAAGANRERLVAKIAGGSDMLDFSEGGSGIGDRNAQRVQETLEQYDIPVVGEDTGGDYGRSLRLNGTNGDLVVTSANREKLNL